MDRLRKSHGHMPISEADSVCLTWYGTASLLLQAENCTIVFDPFAGIPVHKNQVEARLQELRPAFCSASHVFVTHGHLDHICQIPYYYADSATLIHATKLPCQTLRKAGFPPKQLREISPGWQEQIGPFALQAWPSKHCQFDTKLILQTVFSSCLWLHLPHLVRLGRLNRRHPEGGEILLYELLVKGLRIQIMGSLNLAPDISYPTGADVLILPYQGRSDLAEYAVPIVNRLQPNSILLDHWDNSFPPLSRTIDTSEFQRRAENELGIPCRPLIWGEPINLTAGQKL